MSTGPATSSRRRYVTRPPSHWFLFASLLVALGLSLALHGFGHDQLGLSATSAPGPVAGLTGVGSVLDFSGSTVRSIEPPAGTVALTFDDGPDPRWTPALLRVLARHHVRATFFVVGGRVVDHPSLVRDEVRAGHEVGSHTFSNADLGRVSRTRENVELALTQTALAGAAGIETPLLRLPASSTAARFTRGQLAAARAAAAYGYLVVAADAGDLDVDASPPVGSGTVLQFHDGGGDRATTVAAVDRLLTRLQPRGTRFVTVSELVGVSPGHTNPKVSGAARWQGRFLIGVSRVAGWLSGLLVALLLPIALLLVTRTVLVVVLAGRHARAAGRAATAALPGPPPSVSVLVPAYNEEAGIAAAVRSIAATTHPDVEIIVIDDGSTDGTAAIVAGLDLPNVRLIRQANAGKAAALNTGIDGSTGEVVVMADGDTVFEPETIGLLAGAFADPAVGAVSGNAKVANRRRLLGRWQHIEYVTGFNLDRRMLDVMRCMPTVPGAVGGFRRSALVGVGGLSVDTLAEDTDLTFAVTRAGWRVVYEERARAWTEAPGSLTDLWRQRYRWCYGTMQAVWKHRRAFLERGTLGRFGLPYTLIFQVLLPLLAPAIDVAAVYGVVFLEPRVFAGYWVGFTGLQLAVAAYAFHLDGESPRPLWALPLQQVVYRQLMYLVVIQSAVSAWVGRRLHWQKLRRIGIEAPPVASP